MKRIHNRSRLHSAMWNPKPYRRWRKARNPCEATNGSLFKHVELYSFTRNLANLKNDKQWMELFELACKEKNQDKLATYFDEILRLLDEQVRLDACWGWQTARRSSVTFKLTGCSRHGLTCRRLAKRAWHQEQSRGAFAIQMSLPWDSNSRFGTNCLSCCPAHF